MKKILLAAAIAVSAVANLSAQKKTDFEGKVTYAISFEGSGLPPEALTMLNGSESVNYIKGDKRRTDLNMAIQSTSAIIDSKTKDVVTLMDIMGQKYLIRMTEADLKKEEEKNPVTGIKYSDETKTIAGYKCKKAEASMKVNGKDETATVWYTEEIPTSEVKSVYKGLKGFPMEYMLNQSGIKMTFTAKSVSKETVPDTKFEIPKEGYTETTMEDFQKSMQKMGAQ
ncbi:MAG TPA: GLPGLI family protein [Bacteroidia bacterium]|jgi:GLPGLI family protein